jgi:protein-S-isoprenylcysteine O-methyltransferase Ste14
MSTPTYIAWSLAAAGGLALLMVVLARYVRKPDMQITGKVGQIATVLATLFYGSILTREFAYFFLATEAPAWTRLLSSSVILVLGLFFLLSTRRRESESPMRVYAGALIAIGTLILLADTYRYAISLGTAGAVSLS